jgi:hypothetical protein
MKSPPRQYTDHEACAPTRAFVPHDEDSAPTAQAAD